MTELEKDLWKQNQQLTKTVEELTQTIEVLNQKIAELTERLNKNSRNSSKPPSTDGLAKPSPKSLENLLERRRGVRRVTKAQTFA